MPSARPSAPRLLALGALALTTVAGCENPPAQPARPPEQARAESPPTAPAPFDTIRRQAATAETTRVPGASDAPLPGQVTLSADPFTVVPGERIGRVNLGMRVAELVRELGPPDRSDAAMGKAWVTWTSDGPGTPRLDVFATGGTEGPPAVRLVRVTSPDFRTQSGVRPGDTRERVLSFFPDARAVTGPSDTPFLVDRRRGISFECTGTAPRAACPALFVQPVGDDPVATYLPAPLVGQ